MSESVGAANDEAARTLGSAKEARDAQMAALNVEIGAAKAALDNYVSTTRATALAALTRAESKEKAADAKLAAAETAAFDAQTALTEARAKAAALVSDAT